MHPGKKPKKVSSWQAIGALVAHFRKRVRLTQELLAEEASVHVDTIASIEQGRLALQLDRAKHLDELLETGGVLAVAVAKMPMRERIPTFAHDLVDNEQEAVTILSYQTQVVPGLLQTEAYARAVFESRYPPVADETAEQWVAARMDRQAMWKRDHPPWSNFILEEAILRRPVGGREVMREQFRALREYGELACMGVQIMPMGGMPHAGLDGPMVLLETPDHYHLAYLEVQRASFLIDDPDEASLYHLKYGMLRSQALSPLESTRLLDGLLGDS